MPEPTSKSVDLLSAITAEDLLESHATYLAAIGETDPDDFNRLVTLENLALWIANNLGTVDAQIRQSIGADVASASALAIGDDGNFFTVTGTTTVTSIASKGVGTIVHLRFAAALTLTHHSTDLVLPTAANITTEAGDIATFIEYGSGDWRMIGYQRASGAPLNVSEVVDDVTPQLGGPLDTNGHRIRESKGSDITADTTLTVPTDGNFFTVTGNTAITGISTVGVGAEITLRFTGTPTINYNGTDLILPDAAAITVTAGDVAKFREHATGKWTLVSYLRADGSALSGGSGSSSGGAPTAVAAVTSDLTLQNTDAQKLIEIDATMGDVDFTIDPNGTTAYTAGLHFWIRKTAGTATLARGSGVALDYQGTNADLTLATNTIYHIWRRASDSWMVIGEL